MNGDERSVRGYHLAERLGEGGMGVVYRATRVGVPNRPVALKLVRAGLGHRAAADRLAAERELLARMDHPNICRILDAGLDSTGQPFFAMELAEGLPMPAACEARGIPLRARLELFLAVCRGVRHAHQRGVIHRDLKPANVLVTEEDGHAVPKIIDFGIAKALDVVDLGLLDAPTGVDLAGTPDYVAPERFVEPTPALDARVDVYALGIMLHELLVGTHPYRDRLAAAGSIVEVATIVKSLHPLRPSAHRKALRRAAGRRGGSKTSGAEDVTRDLDAVVVRACARDPEVRHPSVDALIEDLELYLRGAAPRTRPPGLVPRVAGVVRRHRIAWLVGLLLLTMFLGAAMTVTSSLVDARTRLAAAIDARERTRDQTGVLRARALVERARVAWPGPGDLAAQLASIDQWFLDAERLVGGGGLDASPAWSELRRWRARLDRRRAILEETWPLWERLADWPRAHGIERRLPPQVGLVPLGIDLDRQSREGDWLTEIWVFAVGGTGEIPVWVDDVGRPIPYGTPGRAELTDDSALLLLLLPGGTYLRGSQRVDPTAPNYDPDGWVDLRPGYAREREQPPVWTTLSPFLIGKTEVSNHHYDEYCTIAAADRPDFFGSPHYGRARQPVAGVRWAEARAFCHFFGLELPTEAQWEFAARAGTDTPLWTGALADGGWRRAWLKSTADSWTHPIATAPGGPFPNWWGLHNTMGNVHEWCLELFLPTLEDAPADGSAPEFLQDDNHRAIRGGSWHTPEREARSSHRCKAVATDSISVRGFRAARALFWD